MRHLIPIAISSSLPAALILGAIEKDKSEVLMVSNFFLLRRARASIPKLQFPLLIFLIPKFTSILLLKSSLTKSAIVPSATKSSKSESIGSGSTVNLFIFLNSIRNASKT